MNSTERYMIQLDSLVPHNAEEFREILKKNQERRNIAWMMLEQEIEKRKKEKQLNNEADARKGFG